MVGRMYQWRAALAMVAVAMVALARPAEGQGAAGAAAQQIDAAYTAKIKEFLQDPQRLMNRQRRTQEIK